MSARDALTGRTLGEFVLRERIGEGGFGAVYRCEQPLLGREAVIKVLHTSLRGSEVVLQRFTREAQLASRLDHPYAAHIYAFGVEKDDGLCWIAMELVHGTTLDRWLRDRGPLPIAQLVPFFERVAEVVQTAHEAGIVHRDLKPSNIMVIERAGRLLPKLLDFGIAKMVDTSAPPAPRATPVSMDVIPAVAAGDDETLAAEPTPAELDRTAAAAPDVGARPLPSEVATVPPDLAATGAAPAAGGGVLAQLTKADATIGSPPYMSPEQWLDATKVGPRSDLYALGICAYEALLGRRPFVASTMSGLAQMHCNDPVPPVDASAPPALDRFFARALAKAPEERPATALELAAMLRVAAGIGAAPEDVPRLEEALRDAWLAEAPQSLAEGVAGLDSARNLHQARDAARDLFRSLIRYALALALAARAQLRGERDELGVRDLLRGLRTRELDEDERVKLLRLLVRPFADRRAAYPIPELVDLCAQPSPLDAMLELRPTTDHVGTEDLVRSQLVQFLPALAKVMRAMAFALDYALVIPREGAAERWMGLRRQRRGVAVVRGEAVLAEQQAVLLDREGRAALILSPLVQAVAPTSLGERELFVFDGRGRLGARLVAAPAGYEHHDPAVWDWFAEHVLGEVQGEEAKREDDRPPYLGLATFSASDADRFVGREREIDAFVNRLRKQALQVVVGPSGAGKSSFVHAGVVPGLPPGWRAVTLRPGAAPLTALATKLAAAGVSSADLRPVLESAPAALSSLVAHAAGDGAIVIVIDQFEEVFTLCPNAEERDRFATALAHLSASPDGATRVICTVRDDFLMNVESLAPLRASLSASLFLIGNPSREDLVRTIVEPARRIGYELSDPELAADMVNVVADRPGALALLSFAASRLWELRDRRFRQLTRRAYDGMGGVAGALGQHAESVFLGLVGDEQRVARAAFRHLVTADQTRAVIVMDELRQRLASSRADAVIGKLVDARLLAVVEGDKQSTIEIIHEALIRAWPRLQAWTREDNADARNRDEIRAAAQKWAERQKPKELLWRGDLLADLARWRGRVALSVLEAEFADASQAEATRGARIRRGLVVVALLVAAVFVVLQYRASRGEQAARANAEDLLRASTLDQGRLRMLAGDKLGALPFLAKAYEMGETGDATRFMIEEALRPTRARRLTLAGHTDKLRRVVYSPDGKLIATASIDRTARVWDAETGAQRDVFELTGEVDALAFSADGRLLAAGGRDANVRLWDLRTRAPAGALPVPERVMRLAFSPDGAYLLVVGEATIRRFTLADRTAQAVVDAPDGIDAVYSGDASKIVAWGPHRVVVWDARTLAEVGHEQVEPQIVIAASDRTGAVIALGTTDGELDLLGVGSGGMTRVALPHAHGASIEGIAFAPDGMTLATASSDGTARLWSATGTRRGELVGHSAAITGVWFSGNGELVLTASQDHSVRLWAAATGTPLGEFVGHRGAVVAAAFQPGDAKIVTASWDHRAMVWDVRAGTQFRAVPPARFSPWLPVTSAKYAPTGDRLGVVTPDGVLVVATSGGPGCEVPPLDRAEFEWSPDGRVLAEFAYGNEIRVIDAERCTITRRLVQPDVASSVRFTDQGELLVGGTTSVHVWDLATGQHVRDLADVGGAIGAITTAPGRRIVAIAEAETQSVVLQELDGARRKRAFLAGQSELTSAALDPLHHQVVASSYDQHLYVWDEASGELRTRLEGSGPLLDARISPNGQVVVGVGGASPVVWDLASHARLAELSGHTGWAMTGAFLGEELFVTAGRDHTARVWDMKTFHPVAILTAAQGVALNAAGTRVLLIDAGSAREWHPTYPAPDAAEVTRVTAEQALQ